MSALLWMLLGCPKAPAPAPAPEPAPAQVLEVREPPLPPPAPVELAFAWPPGSACLMSTRRTEQLSTSGTVISTLNGVGSGVVFASKRDDGTWEVALEDRTGTARHSPSKADLLVALERVSLDQGPILEVSADGTAVTAVRGLDDVYAEAQRELETLAGAYNTEVQALWLDELPKVHAPEALQTGWADAWASGWGFAYGHTWVAGEPVERTAATGPVVQATYEDVVPCKFNEDEPLCIRLTVAFPEAEITDPDARLRAQLPPGAERTATASSRVRKRTGEVVIEAATGLPWRWTTTDVEQHVYAYGDDNETVFDLERKQDVSCDWRVAE